jgi:protein disulfide-isomerase A1
LAFCFLVFASAEESDVLTLDTDNFDETISENEFVMVEFYAPWCGHCKKLAPDYEKLATLLRQEGSPAKVAKIDATEHSGPAGQYGVRGYPTLIFFKNGNQIKYEGGRTVDEMKVFINKKSGPASRFLATRAEHDAAIKGDVIVAYVEDEESTEFKNWMRAATSGQLEDFALAHVHDKSIAGDLNGKVVIYKAGDEKLVFEDDKITKTKLVSWITTEGYPLAEEIGQPVWQRATNNKGKLAVIFVDSADKEQMDLVKTLAKQYKGKISFSFAPTATQKQLAERWGASGQYFPTGVYADFADGNPTIYVFDEETESRFDATSGARFLDQAMAGTYKSFLKSEPLPTQSGPVNVLVGKNFEQVAFDDSADVFVEFYAPWCGHCKKLAPTWDELAENFKDFTHLKIAKIDATANALPPAVKVSGYPTLIYFPAGNGGNTQIPYNGERDLESLTKFIIEKSTKPIDLAGKQDL